MIPGKNPAVVVSTRPMYKSSNSFPNFAPKVKNSAFSSIFPDDGGVNPACRANRSGVAYLVHS